jgi:hypothetical protein
MMPCDCIPVVVPDTVRPGCPWSGRPAIRFRIADLCFTDARGRGFVLVALSGLIAAAGSYALLKMPPLC